MFSELFHFELAMRCRRRQLHIYRWLYAAWVLMLFLICFSPRFGQGGNLLFGLFPIRNVVDTFFGVMLWQRFLFVLAATPAFVAGQITEEKERGILQFVLMTPLEASAIVPAKLLAQGALLTTVLLLDVPLFLMAWGLEDFSLATLAAHTICMVVLIFALGAGSLLAAIYCRTTRAVLLLTYLISFTLFAGSAALQGGLARAASVAVPTTWSAAAAKMDAFLSHFLGVIHPSYVANELTSQSSPAEWSIRVLAFALVWCLLALLLVAVAIRKLRPVSLAQVENLGKPRRTLWRKSNHPPIGRDPVEWKACYVDGLGTLGVFANVPRWLGVIGLMAFAAMLALWDRASGPLLPGAGTAGLCCGGVLAMVMLVRVATLLPAEQQRDTFDALLLTGKSIGECIDGFFGGLLKAFRPYLLGLTVVLLMIAAPEGFAEVVFALGWAGAALIAVYVTGLVGFMHSSGLWGVLHNLTISGWAAGWSVLMIGGGHFVFVGLGISLPSGGYAPLLGRMSVFVIGVLLSQFVPILLLCLSRPIRNVVLVFPNRKHHLAYRELEQAQARR